MRVLHVTTRYPPGPGGVERHVREVVIRLRRRGVDASVLTSDLFTEIPWARLPQSVVTEKKTSDGVPVHRHRALALSGDLHYPVLPGLFLDILRAKPDVVHVHTYGTYHGFSALLAERLRGIPYVVTAHFHPTWSIWGGEGRKRLRRIYDARFASAVLGHCSRLIVQTREEERLVREVVAELPPVSIIPPGYAPLPAREPGTAGTRPWKGEEPYFLFVGRLASNKGLRTLVRALSRLPRKDVSLAVVGEDGGSREEMIREARALGIEDRLKMVGFLEEESALAASYRNATALVLPSEYEAFGLVLLEALSQGTPVIGSRVGGIPEVVEEGRNGLLFTSGDAEGLARQMTWLLDHPQEARGMGEYGRSVTSPRYTWERVVDSLLPLYETVARGGPGK